MSASPPPRASSLAAMVSPSVDSLDVAVAASDHEESGLHALATPTAMDAMAVAHQPPPGPEDDAMANYASANSSSSGGGNGPLIGAEHGSGGVGMKRKRVVLSIHEKQQVLQRLEAGEQPIAIARTFGISRQQVSDIKKNKERILSFCIDAKHLSTLRRKTLRATSEYHPGVEQELYRWMIRQRRLERAVTSEALTAKTTDLFMQYSAEDAANVSFKAITNWLRHFKRAHGIKTFTDEEFERLPDRFEPAMDMTRALSSVDAPSTQPQSLTATSLDATVTTASSNSASVITTVAMPNNFFVNVVSNPVGSGNAAASATLVNSAALAASTATSGLSVNVMDVNPYINGVGVSGFGGGGSTASLQAAVNAVHQLNSQVARFEHDMAIKLDYLDERVAKLCYLVLPPRFS